MLVGRSPASLEVVRLDGTTEKVTLSHEDTLTFATIAAQHFGVGTNRTGKIEAKIEPKIEDKIKPKKGKEEEDAPSAAEGGEGA